MAAQKPKEGGKGGKKPCQNAQREEGFQGTLVSLPVVAGAESGRGKKGSGE